MPMPSGVNKNLAAFQQLARKAATSSTELGDRTHTSSVSMHLGHHHHHGPQGPAKGTLNKPAHNAPRASATNISFNSAEVGGSYGSQDELSSGEGSDLEFHRGGERKRGLVYQKTENIITRIRDLIAQSDVFVVRRESPPFVACLQISVWFIPILVMFLLWDTLAVTAFEVPDLSWIDHPGFMLGWHFVMLALAMYGFMLSYLSSGHSPRTSLAGVSLGIHYLLLFYRLFMEIFFDGFRGQDKLYIEKTGR